jgi:hypothetical protein
MLLLGPVNMHIFSINLNSLPDLLMGERRYLLNSDNCNFLNFITKKYLFLELVSFGLEVIIKLAITQENSRDLFGILDVRVWVHGGELRAFKDVFDGRIGLKLRYKITSLNLSNRFELKLIKGFLNSLRSCLLKTWK